MIGGRALAAQQCPGAGAYSEEPCAPAQSQGPAWCVRAVVHLGSREWVASGADHTPDARIDRPRERALALVQANTRSVSGNCLIVGRHAARHIQTMTHVQAWRTLFAIAAIVCCSLATTAGAPQTPGTRAIASFTADHGNQCTTTTATIEVIDNPNADAGDPAELQSRVTFHWNVFGQPLDPGCDGLWYYFLDGEAPLTPGEFSAHPNRRSATLEKVLRVLDGESGSTFDVVVTVTWAAERDHRLAAQMRISAPQIGPRWTDDPLESETATLTRLRRP